MRALFVEHRESLRFVTVLVVLAAVTAYLLFLFPMSQPEILNTMPAAIPGPLQTSPWNHPPPIPDSSLAPNQ